MINFISFIYTFLDTDTRNADSRLDVLDKMKTTVFCEEFIDSTSSYDKIQHHMTNKTACVALKKLNGSNLTDERMCSHSFKYFLFSWNINAGKTQTVGEYSISVLKIPSPFMIRIVLKIWHDSDC